MTGRPEDRLGDFFEPEDQALANEHSPEFRSYMDELFRRLPGYARRAATIPAGKKGSVEWFREIGKFWWEAREKSGLTRFQLVETAGLHVNQVRFLEFGLATPEELDDDLMQDYAKALRNPGLYGTYKHRFDPSSTQPKP